MTTNAAFWNGIAEKYARSPVRDPDAFDRKIAITRSLMTPDSVVLDIGCGTGSLALRLSDSAAHVHGLDVSSEMVRIARGKAQRQGTDNVTFHVGAFDERFEAFGPASLDGICAYSILHLVPDRAAALAQIHRTLKPGGFFVASTVCLRESLVPFRPLIWVMQRLGKAPAVSHLKRRRVVDDIVQAGFVDVTTPDVGASKMVAFTVARKARS